MDLIISAIANYNIDKIKNYINSISTCGFTGDKVMIVYNVNVDTVKYLHDNGWIVMESELRGHPHMCRLIDIYQAIKELDKKYRFIITTDVRDVVFQTDPSKYLEFNLKNKILASSENVSYINEPWGKKNILEGYNELLLDRYANDIICNVGVLAGYYDEMLDLLLLNYLVSQSGNTTHYTDQSSFNFLVHSKMLKNNIQIEGLETNWALQIGTLDNPNLIHSYNIKIENGLVMNGDKPFVIVHQYDRHNLTKNLY